jgi:hypothetical protein
MLKDKISDRMDALEDMMNMNLHLNNSEMVYEQIQTVSKFWSVLTEEDRDYIEACRCALEEKQVWKDDK